MRYQDTATYRAVTRLCEKVLHVSEEQTQRQMQDMANGILSCPHCHARVDFRTAAPLSLANCPECNELLFIPMEVEEWWITQPLAAGAYGSVYLGRSKNDPREKVSLKVLQRREDITPEDERVFRWECEVGSRIGQHPNLVRVLKSGVWEGVSYMVMEYVDGERLSEYIASTRGNLPVEECLYYLFDLSNGLEHLLAEGYLHRDVKPENVIIANDGRAVLVDYGSCLPEELARNAAPGAAGGSPHFVSPERYMRISEDVRSDIYSLGMLGYYALEGRHFASGDTLKGVQDTHTRSVRLRLANKMSIGDMEVIEMIDRMVRREPAERLSSYEEVRQYVLYILAKYHLDPAPDHRVAAQRKHFLATFGKISRDE